MYKRSLTATVMLCVFAFAMRVWAQDPWDTPVGQMCFEQWIQDTERRVNGLDDPTLNGRKPWYINEYGLWASRTPFGPSSVSPPDNFRQYRNKYHYMWVEYYALPQETSTMRVILRKVNTPDLRTFVLRCIDESGGAVAGRTGSGSESLGPAPQGFVGQWEFGRVLPRRERLCTLHLTGDRGAHGYVIKGCNPNESFWRVEGQELIFLNKAGVVTSRLRAESQNRWVGPYVLDPKAGITHYLQPVGAPPGGGAAWEPSTNRPGGDYRSYSLGPEWCRDACDRDPQCRAWTFVKAGVQGDAARCYLKSSVPAGRPDANCVSGVKGGR